MRDLHANIHLSEEATAVVPLVQETTLMSASGEIKHSLLTLALALTSTNVSISSVGNQLGGYFWPGHHEETEYNILHFRKRSENYILRPIYQKVSVSNKHNH